MEAVKRTVFEVLILGVAGLLIGFGYNAVRAHGAISPQFDYFAKGTGEGPEGGSPRAGAVGEVDSGRTEHPYQEIRFTEVVDVLNDPDTEMGLNVFVDARNPGDYAEGHIPGAIRCDPYEVAACIDEVLDVALVADKVIVYCGGGECEDSIFMCRELVSAGIEFEAVYVYAGGWTEWTANEQPVEGEMQE